MTPEHEHEIRTKQAAYRDAVRAFDAARKARVPVPELERLKALADRAEAAYEAAIDAAR
jgi:hypothetical protein